MKVDRRSPRRAAAGAALLLLAAQLFAPALDASVAWAVEESWDESSHSGGGGGKSGGGGVKPAPADTKAPAPAPAPPSPAPTPDFAKQLEEAKKLLKETPEGAVIAKFLDDNRVPIEYDPSDGYYFNGTKIVLNTNSPERMALDLVHEANHAMQKAAGKTADVNKETRDEYVRKMLEEEITGTVNAIELKQALLKKGKTISAVPPLESDYVDAYKKAVDELKKSNPSASEADLDAAGKKAGREAVKKGFDSGKIVTSNTHEKYAIYYGKEWDKAHPATK